MILSIKPSSYFMNWHTVFAWWPVEIKDGQLGWMINIERKYEWRGVSGSYYNPQYRFPKPKEPKP
tara:strand:+ start:918 stop:1112 length:195 start_codon:yes stop_codon:yes gene_type:complete